MMQPADLLLVSDQLPFSRLVQLAQRLAGYGDASRWNHIAIVEDAMVLIEATPGGIKRTPVGYYLADGSKQTRVISLALSAEDRAQALAFARGQIGRRYGFLTIISVALRLLRVPWVFEAPGTYTCAGFVAEALERAGYELDGEWASPAGIARALCQE